MSSTNHNNSNSGSSLSASVSICFISCFQKSPFFSCSACVKESVNPNDKHFIAGHKQINAVWDSGRLRPRLSHSSPPRSLGVQASDRKRPSRNRRSLQGWSVYAVQRFASGRQPSGKINKAEKQRLVKQKQLCGHSLTLH